MELKFRNLRADEIDCRIGTAKEGKGVSLLLYKDARCDMAVLDEAVGSMNWQKSYSRENKNCTVSIWDEDKKAWISKEDTGTESNTEAEKGLASDSFKRACVNWGIGRELYTAPFIWVSGASKYDKFWVKDMEVSPDKKITALTICTCDSYGNHKDDVAFQFPKGGKKVEKKVEKKDPEESPRGLRPIIDMNDPEATEAEMNKPIDAAAWRGLQRELKEAGLDPQKVLDFYEIPKPSAITWDMLGRIRSEKKFIATLDELKTEVA